MTRRWPARVLFLAAATALAVSAPAFGQGGAKDTVAYFDHKEGKVVTAADTTVKKESAAGIEIAVGKDSKLIPAPDIVRVDYGGLPGLTVSDLVVAKQLEEADDLAKAQARYSELLKKFGSASPKTKKYLAFKEAAVAADVADLRTKPEEFKAEAERAVKLLTDFAQQNDKSWEVWPALRTVARIQMELGDFKAAADTLGKLAKNPDLTPDLRADVRTAELAAKLRAGTDVSGEVSQLERDPKFPASGPGRDKLNVLKAAARFPKPVQGAAKPAEAVAAMEKAIADASDPAARAAGYGLLGDLYKAHGLNRDAMWAYLWVDVVYPQDKDERVVALHRLGGVFDALGDGDRAAQFRDKLPAAR